MRPGYLDRPPVPVPPFKAEDVRSAEAGKVLLERGHPRFELAATLLAPVIGVPTFIKSPRNSRQGAGFILLKISAANSNT